MIYMQAHGFNDPYFHNLSQFLSMGYNNNIKILHIMKIYVYVYTHTHTEWGWGKGDQTPNTFPKKFLLNPVFSKGFDWNLSF